MRHTSRIAAVSLLAIAVAACGGPEAEEDVAAIEAEEVVEAGGDALPAEAEGEGAAGEEGEAAGEEPAAEATAAPTPSPTPTATRTPTPTPTPTRAAAPAGPPQAFTQCQVCHQVAPGKHGIGPSLAGVFGSRAGQKAGFSYTEGMRSSNLTWNEANLNRYLSDPSGVVPGTTMAVGPLSAEQRTAIINYLKTL
ncbi:c-type cytochrome [Alteraurantiacibacter aquimixticola]|nr:c-type cytochrome [Alteraurantiacibacter aquimixticola]